MPYILLLCFKTNTSLQKFRNKMIRVKITVLEASMISLGGQFEVNLFSHTLDTNSLHTHTTQKKIILYCFCFLSMVLVAYNNGTVTIITKLANIFFSANGHYNAGLKVIIFTEPERTISKEGMPAYQPHTDYDNAQSHFSSVSKNKQKTPRR